MSGNNKNVNCHKIYTSDPGSDDNVLELFLSIQQTVSEGVDSLIKNENEKLEKFH